MPLHTVRDRGSHSSSDVYFEISPLSKVRMGAVFVSREVRFMTPDDPWVSKSLNCDISEYAYEHFNFPRWEKHL